MLQACNVLKLQMYRCAFNINLNQERLSWWPHNRYGTKQEFLMYLPPYLVCLDVYFTKASTQISGCLSSHNCILAFLKGIWQEKLINANVLFPRSNTTPISVFSLTVCFGKIFCYHHEKFYIKKVNYSSP